jgi:hypothetical protein
MEKKEKEILEAELSKMSELKPQLMAAQRVAQRAILQQINPFYFYFGHSCGTEDCAKLTIDRVSIVFGPRTGVGSLWTTDDENWAKYKITVTNTTDAKLRNAYLIVSVTGSARIKVGMIAPQTKRYWSLGDLNPDASSSTEIQFVRCGTEGGNYKIEAKISAEVVPFAESKPAVVEDEIIKG